MAQYKAGPGMEDRDGEMTGAITINMVFTMPTVCIWCVFIGPLFFESVWPTLVIGLVMGAAMSIGLVPVSRRVWARISDYMDQSKM